MFFTTVIRYAKASTRELTARLFALPRELRDTVYEKLWETASSLPQSLLKLTLIKHDGSGYDACLHVPVRRRHCHLARVLRKHRTSTIRAGWEDP
jgi:hypothetical protein